MCDFMFLSLGSLCQINGYPALMCEALRFDNTMMIARPNSDHEAKARLSA